MAAGKLDLTTDWQLLTAGSAVLTGKAYDGSVQVINATGVPTGATLGAMTLATHVALEILPAPSEGELYVRVSNGTGELSFYEVM